MLAEFGLRFETAERKPKGDRTMKRDILVGALAAVTAFAGACERQTASLVLTLVGLC